MTDKKTDMPDLLPCPICRKIVCIDFHAANHGVSSVNGMEFNNPDRWEIICRSNKDGHLVRALAESEEAVIRSWNTRADLPAASVQDFIDKQKPLDPEYAKVWTENAFDLYERADSVQAGDVREAVEHARRKIRIMDADEQIALIDKDCLETLIAAASRQVPQDNKRLIRILSRIRGIAKRWPFKEIFDLSTEALALLTKEKT